MRTLLISACLLGIRCRYDGKSKALPGAAEWNEKYTLLPVCPEVMGGLATPRPPCEIREGRVLTETGTDCTGAYQKGAELTLALAKAAGCRYALMKEKSPSCGCGLIHDGTFRGGCREGDGITAGLLKQNGIRVFGESQTEELLALFAPEDKQG